MSKAQAEAAKRANTESSWCGHPGAELSHFARCLGKCRDKEKAQQEFPGSTESWHHSATEKAMRQHWLRAKSTQA